MKQLLLNLFNQSADIFFKDEAENILNDVAERNLCGRLAIIMSPKLAENGIGEYFADVEYNRKQNGQIKTIIDDDFKVITIQCDLIIHSRGNIQQDNLIAIEMKKSTRPESEKVDDRNRLRAMTKDIKDDVYSADGGITHPEHVCGYILGVYMILNLKQKTWVLEYYQKGNQVDEKIIRF